MSHKIELREVLESDLQIFFNQQLDREANQMAAFTSKDPSDKAAFLNHWKKILSGDTIEVKTILVDRGVVGHVLSYVDQEFSNPEVSYWIGKEFWGRGIATKALSEFLCQVKIRPIYARVAKDNVRSFRVLEKCKSS